MSCQFCKTVEGSVASTAIYSDELGCAFADINPQDSVHVVIVPREQSPALDDTDMRNSGVLSHLLEMATSIAQAKHLSAGYRIVVNPGDEGDQSAHYLHVHLLAAGNRYSKSARLPI
jgi:histidine triad (HIT) family protein